MLIRHGVRYVRKIARHDADAKGEGRGMEGESSPLVIKIALLTDNDAGDFGLARVVEDLVMYDLDHIERITVCDAVD